MYHQRNGSRGILICDIGHGTGSCSCGVMYHVSSVLLDVGCAGGDDRLMMSMAAARQRHSELGEVLPEDVTVVAVGS